MVVKQLLRPLVFGAIGLAMAAATASAAPPVAQRHPAPAATKARPAAAPTTEPFDPTKIHDSDKPSFVPPAAGSAWAALGFNRRFLKVGDSWRYAWSARKRLSPLKRAIFPTERAHPVWNAAILIDYRVTKVAEQHIGGQKRQTATITAIYASSVQGHLQTANELKVDQYLNPLERCVYTQWTPFGTCRDRDARSVVRSMGAVPLFLGDVERVPAKAGSLPPIAPTLQKAAATMVKGAQYLLVPVASGQRVYANSYWAPGNVMPSYVAGKDIHGVLVGQRLAR